MKCPNCGDQITYRDFDELVGTPFERKKITRKICRCKEHGNDRHCRECCEFEVKAGADASAEDVAAVENGTVSL